MRFTVESVNPDFYACHCTMCLRWCGGPFLSVTAAGFAGTGPNNPTRWAVYGDFQKALLQRYETRGVETIGGAEDSFVWLGKRNVKIALTTGFYRNLADRLIHRVGWEGSFDAVVCNDAVPRGRPAPDLIFRAMEWTACENFDRVAVVGDTAAQTCKPLRTPVFGGILACCRALITKNSCCLARKPR